MTDALTLITDAGFTPRVGQGYWTPNLNFLKARPLWVVWESSEQNFMHRLQRRVHETEAAAVAQQASINNLLAALAAE